jgi:hypothetical protein
MRAIAIGTLVVTGLLIAGCDSGSGGGSGPDSEGPLPLPSGDERHQPADDELQPTDEALEACGWPFPVPPVVGSEEATELEECLRALRGYPDPVRVPVELLQARLVSGA